MRKSKWITKNDGKINEFFFGKKNVGNKDLIIFTIAKQL